MHEIVIKELEWEEKKLNEDIDYWLVIPKNCSIKISIELMGENRDIAKGKNTYKGIDSLEKAKKEIQKMHEEKVKELLDNWIQMK